MANAPLEEEDSWGDVQFKVVDICRFICNTKDSPFPSDTSPELSRICPLIIKVAASKWLSGRVDKDRLRLLGGHRTRSEEQFPCVSCERMTA